MWKSESLTEARILESHVSDIPSAWPVLWRTQCKRKDKAPSSECEQESVSPFFTKTIFNKIEYFKNTLLKKDISI